MERRMRGNSHVRCEVGENPEISSRDYLSLLNSEDVHKEKYISDQWWYTKEEVMHDLETKNFLKYGKKYDAFWRL